MNNWTEISAPNLTHNFTVLQRASPGTEVLAVVKANAYGHGAEPCAAILAKAGARWLGVTCASEGARVRLAVADPTVRILVMSGFLPEDVPAIVQHDLTPVLWTHEQIHWLAGHPSLRVHVEVDTGMGRQGVLPAELPQLLALLQSEGLILDGIFTHFCSSEVANSALTRRQQTLFEQALTNLPVRPVWLHAGNSSSIDNPVTPPHWLTELALAIGARPMVRSGLALYGHALPIEGAAVPHIRPELKPVLTWRARILATRTLTAGETVGYNATFTAARPMRVALLPVGYADGLRRELSSPAGWVIIAGRRAPILGRISMNLTVVDITHIPGVQPTDQATLLGPGITAEDHATLAHTIPYEILCAIHPCN